MTVRQMGKSIRDQAKYLPQALTHNKEEMLSSTVVKGYPIVSNDDRNLLLGYVGRTELRYVLGECKPHRAPRTVSHAHSRRQGAQSPRHGGRYALFVRL